MVLLAKDIDSILFYFTPSFWLPWITLSFFDCESFAYIYKLFFVSVLNFVTQDRPMGSGTSVGSMKPFYCQNIFNGNIYLNIFYNPITTAQNGHITMIRLAKPTSQSCPNNLFPK